MIRLPPISTRTDTLFPYTTLFRSKACYRIALAVKEENTPAARQRKYAGVPPWQNPSCRSEEHTSELQSLMRISYAVFCLKKKNTSHPIVNNTITHLLDKRCTLKRSNNDLPQTNTLHNS